MGKVVESALELIGNTPVLKADRYAEKAGVTTGEGKIYAKLECFNPAGSAKDRVALAMVEDAEVSTDDFFSVYHMYFDVE